MEMVLAVINWVKANWLQICEAVTMVIGAASIIVKLTPTLKDDNILLGVVKFLGKYIALNNNITDADRPK